jgi:hypothetical protein
MNVEHKDIDKFIPYGEMLRGYANQSIISNAEIHRILKERGVFTLNQEKEYTVPILQTLLLSPREFEEVRNSFSKKEDNEKAFSREINWATNESIFIPEILSADVNDYMKRSLPTCELKHPIIFTKFNDNQNHLIAEFTLYRHDRNKSWFEQTNEFTGKVEFINENGKGHIRITHTAPETKDLAEQIVKVQVNKYKQKSLIRQDEKPRKILFSEFTNETRFVFFYRLTTHLDTDYFTCENIKDVSIKPEEDASLPDEIQWMDKLKKILLSGDSLDKKDFMKDKKFHKSLVLWSVDATYAYDYLGEKGKMILNLGFPDYSSKVDNSEFEINISQFSTERSMDAQNKKKLKSKILSEMDRQKTIVYNRFLEYLNSNK